MFVIVGARSKSSLWRSTTFSEAVVIRPQCPVPWPIFPGLVHFFGSVLCMPRRFEKRVNLRDSECHDLQTSQGVGTKGAVSCIFTHHSDRGVGLV